MRTFNLYLSTMLTSPTSNYVIPVNKSNLASVTWNVDFENLFRGWNKKYKRCTLRFFLLMSDWGANTTDWDTFNGYLTCNLPSVAGSSTVNGTMLGLVYPTATPTSPDPPAHTHCMIVNTLGDQQGVDIMIPQGVQNVTLQFYRDRDPTVGTTFMAGVVDYQIQLLFELSEPIEGSP